MVSRSSQIFLSRQGIFKETGRPAPRLGATDLLIMLLPARQPTVDLIRAPRLVGEAPDWVITIPYPREKG